MRMPWNKPKSTQLDLLDELANAPTLRQGSEEMKSVEQVQTLPPPTPPKEGAPRKIAGQPLVVPVTCLYEDSNNPRTEFPDTELDELAEDIRQHGILQPVVVHPADAQGRYRIHFGAKRWRAALRAGLAEVPFVVRNAAADPYAQIAENQKRHGLTPLDLARFIKSRVIVGESNAHIAKRLGMNLTAVAHHLSLLDLPPVLDKALKTGRCTSPRTLHELSALHGAQPETVRALVEGEGDITRSAVAAMKGERSGRARSTKPDAPVDALARAHAACDGLESALARIDGPPTYSVALPELVALRIRVEDITRHRLWGSDRQTPRADPTQV